ncbi:MAG: SGNH hydrolase domain-containing protein [Vicinamibacterales bacterium]
MRRSKRIGAAATLCGAVAIAIGCGAAAVTWKLAAARWSATPAQARFTAMKNDFPELHRMGCDDYFHSAAVKECGFGPTTSPRTVVLIGDSHAGHWLPAVRRAFADTMHWRLILLTKSSCPVVTQPFFLKEIGREYTECFQWLNASLAHIAHSTLIWSSPATLTATDLPLISSM